MNHRQNEKYSNESSNAKRHDHFSSFDMVGSKNKNTITGSNNSIKNGIFCNNCFNNNPLYGKPESKYSNGKKRIFL